MSADLYLVHPGSKRMLDLGKAGYDLLTNDSPPLVGPPDKGVRLLMPAGHRAIYAEWSPWSGEFRERVIAWLAATTAGPVLLIDSEFRYEHPKLAAAMGLDEDCLDYGWTCEEATS